MRGELIERKYENPLFSHVKRTVILSHERSRIALNDVIAQVDRMKPTELVTIFVSEHWSKKNDPNITNGIEDVHENWTYLFSRFYDEDRHTLLLEDDYNLWKMWRWEAVSIDSFIKNVDPDVYLLGHGVQVQNADRFPHLKCQHARGFHAQIVHTRILKAWCEKGIAVFREHRESRRLKQETAQIDTDYNPYALTRCETHNIYTYFRPLATQTFPLATGNREHWNFKLTHFDAFFIKVLLLERYHAGWIVVYLFMHAMYAFGCLMSFLKRISAAEVLWSVFVSVCCIWSAPTRIE